MTKLFPIVLVLMCFALNNNSQLENLEKNFYNSESFLNTLSKTSNKDSLISLIDINNNSFVKVDKTERFMYRNEKDFEKNLTEVRNLFHVFTDYDYYDYRSYNEFELRRKKNEHKKIITDKSILDKNFFIRLDFSSSVLSEYDFDNNYFSIPIKILAKNLGLDLRNISYDFNLP